MSTPTSTLPERTLRGANLETLVQVLQDQHGRKIDIVTAARTLRAHQGAFLFDSLPPQIDDTGVADVNGVYTATPQAISQIADKGGIPTAYLRKLADEQVPLFDENVNQRFARLDDKKVLVRLLHGQHDGGQGIVRAILSDSYKPYDNLDTTMALLAGMREAGLDATNIGACDLSDTRLYLRVVAPEINVMATELFKDYRSPFTGQSGNELPIVHAGLRVSNSEVGGGALAIVPEITALVCNNGMTLTREALRKVHLGSKLDEGQINWSADTREAQGELIAKQVRDAVKSFLSPEFLESAVETLTEAGDKGIEKPEEAIKVVTKQLRMSENESSVLLNHFIRGGQLKASGIMHAVTSMAQEVSDVDRSNEIQDMGVKAMELAASL